MLVHQQNPLAVNTPDQAEAGARLLEEGHGQGDAAPPTEAPFDYGHGRSLPTLPESLVNAKGRCVHAVHLTVTLGLKGLNVFLERRLRGPKGSLAGLPGSFDLLQRSHRILEGGLSLIQLQHYLQQGVFALPQLRTQ